MRPAGLHTHGSDPAEVIGALVVLAAVGAAVVAVVAFIAEFIWAILAAFVVLSAGVIYAGWRMHRKYGRMPTVLPWEQRAALPPPQATPVTARAARALPAPQIQINNFYVATAEQAAEVVARQQREIEGR